MTPDSFRSFCISYSNVSKPMLCLSVSVLYFVFISPVSFTLFHCTFSTLIFSQQFHRHFLFSYFLQQSRLRIQLFVYLFICLTVLLPKRLVFSEFILEMPVKKKRSTPSNPDITMILLQLDEYLYRL